MTSAGCPDVEALAPELALGIVSGSERATAVAHLGHCADCRRLVQELSGVVDPLLLLAPESEPSIGFESRVLTAIAAAKAAASATPGSAPAEAAATATALPALPARRRRRFGPLRVAAAAALILMVAAGGLVAGQAIRDDDEAPVRTALAVSAGGRATCRAFAYGEEHAWVFVSLEAPREWTAEYTVEVTTAGGGRPAAVGQFKLQDGSGSFGAEVDVPASRLRAVRVLDASGALRYEAPFQ